MYKILIGFEIGAFLSATQLEAIGRPYGTMWAVLASGNFNILRIICLKKLIYTDVSSLGKCFA